MSTVATSRPGHPDSEKTEASERRRMTQKMGLTRAQAMVVIRACGHHRAVGAASLALAAETACGGREPALALMNELRPIASYRQACRRILQREGVDWGPFYMFEKHVAGAIALLRSVTGPTVLIRTDRQRDRAPAAV